MAPSLALEFDFKCQLLTLPPTVPASGQGNRPAAFLLAGPLVYPETKSTPTAPAQNACKRAMK